MSFAKEIVGSLVSIVWQVGRDNLPGVRFEGGEVVKEHDFSDGITSIKRFWLVSVSSV